MSEQLNQCRAEFEREWNKPGFARWEDQAVAWQWWQAAWNRRAVPEGYQLVPIEPTSAELEAMRAELPMLGDTAGAVVLVKAMRKAMLAASPKLEEVPVWPETITPALHEVLGKPNFWCARLAGVLRKGGQQIKNRSEDEQAAVLFWLAGLALKHGDGWQAAAFAEVEAIRDREQEQSNG